MILTSLCRMSFGWVEMNENPAGYTRLHLVVQRAGEAFDEGAGDSDRPWSRSIPQRRQRVGDADQNAGGEVEAGDTVEATGQGAGANERATTPASRVEARAHVGFLARSSQRPV